MNKIDSDAWRAVASRLLAGLVEGLPSDQGRSALYQSASVQKVLHAAALADRPYFLQSEQIRSAIRELVGQRNVVNGGSAQLPSKLDSAFNLSMAMVELGRCCPSLRAIYTAHLMVSHGLQEFGSHSELDGLKAQYLQGDRIGCFALTEATGGSDIRRIESRLVSKDQLLLSLTGRKRWITGGALADGGLVFAMLEGAPTAILVDATVDGLTMELEAVVHGLQPYGLTEWTLNEAVLPRHRIVGGEGLGGVLVAPECLAYGRLFVAAGAVGIVLGCMAEVLVRAHLSRNDRPRLIDHQLVRRVITRMHCALQSTFLLCVNAATMLDQRSSEAHLSTMEAKYCATEAALDAVHNTTRICGAAAFEHTHPIGAYALEASVCTVIEGAAEVCEQNIPDYLELVF